MSYTKPLRFCYQEIFQNLWPIKLRFTLWHQCSSLTFENFLNHLFLTTTLKCFLLPLDVSHTELAGLTVAGRAVQAPV